MQIQLPIVLAIITNEDGEVFITQRNDPGTKEHQMWQFPGGKIEFGENVEAAVIREVKEEIGYQVKIMRLLPKIYTHVFYDSKEDDLKGDIQVFLLAYECKIVGGNFQPQDRETLDGKFIKPEDIQEDKFLAYCKEIAELIIK